MKILHTLNTINMKTYIKALLLILLFVGGLAAIFIFAKTQLSPPLAVENTNQYATSLEDELTSFEGLDSFDEISTEYKRLADKILRFHSEGKLEESLSNEYLTEYSKIYGNALVESGYELFEKSEWPEDRIIFLQDNLKKAKTQQDFSGNPVYSQEFFSNAADLESIIKDYRAAQTLSRNTSFVSVSDAKSKIDTSKAYKNKPYLKNNLSLINSLNQLPAKLADSHYSYVNMKVERLSNYKNISRDNYDVLMKQADNAIEEYKSTKIYEGKEKSSQPLVKKAGDYIEAAMKYYASLNPID